MISNHGNVDLSSELFTTAGVPVFLLAGPRCARKVAAEVRRRAWITMIPIEEGRLDTAFARLRHDHHIARISAVGGRTTATWLVDDGLVQDIYLTTTAIDAGEANTPWYAGERMPQLHTIVIKREATTHQPILFEHCAISHSQQSTVGS